MDKYEQNDIRQQTKTGLFEIWSAVVEHKKIFMAVWILLSLSGLIVALMLPAKYSYTTLIGLGQHSEGHLIEPVAVVRAKMNAVIIPVTQKKYIDDGGVYDINVEVLVRSPSMLLLKSRGSIESSQDNYNIHKIISEALLKDHKTILTKQTEKAISTRKKISDHLKELEEENVLLNKNFKRLDGMSASLKVESIKSDANAGLLYIILNNQMELNRAALRRAFTDNIIAISDRRSQLDQIEKGLDGQRETFYAVPTTQSKSAVAPNRVLIALGGILSGLVIGILGVLFFDTIAKLRRG